MRVLLSWDGSGARVYTASCQSVCSDKLCGVGMSKGGGLAVWGGSGMWGVPKVCGVQG